MDKHKIIKKTNTNTRSSQEQTHHNDKHMIITNKDKVMRIHRFTPQMNVTEIVKRTEKSGEEPDWGTIMSKIPKVIK